MPSFRWSSVAVALVVCSLGPAAEHAHAQSAHVVQPGETLSQIALDAGVDPAALASLNGLDDPNALSVGQSLKLSGAGSTYTVADGDTLWGIAQRFNTTTDALLQANKLDDPNHLVIGTSLTVAGGTVSAAPASTPSPVSAPVATPITTHAQGRTLLVSYTVQAGETLGAIARQFNVRADAIAQASSLDDPNKLAAGAVLKVPVSAKQHVVSGGETLRDIAAAEKVDLGSLIDFNGLDDPELIRVGQVLVLPVPAGGQQQAASVKPSGTPVNTPSTTTTPTPSSTPTSTPTPSSTPPPTLSTAALTPKPTATPAPRAPVAVVSPPAGAPTDGFAAAGLKLLGSPYVWGGSSPSGFDCSGFVWYVARQIGKSVSRGLFAQYSAGTHPARDQLQIGDLVFFQNTFTPGLSHNGIYIGNGQFVHAADEDAGVTISSLSTAYWSSHWFGATRLT